MDTRTPLNKSLEDVALNIFRLAHAIQAEVDKLETFKLSDAAVFYWQVKSAYKEVDDARKSVYALVDKMDKMILPEMFDKQDLDMFRVPEIARSFYPQTKYSASIIPDKKDEAYDWLRSNGLGELIQPTVNAGSLSSALKDMMLEEGIDAPAELIKFSTYKTIGSSKYTPKNK